MNVKEFQIIETLKLVLHKHLTSVDVILGVKANYLVAISISLMSV